MEKKKRHPNFIDIVFIVLIAAVAVTAYWLSHRGADMQQAVPRTYTLELAELTPEAAALIEVGDPVVDNIKNYPIGTVVNVELAPTTICVLNENAMKYHFTEVPNKVTAMVTIEVDTVETERDLTTVSGYNLRVGTLVSCSIEDLTASGYILYLDR